MPKKISRQPGENQGWALPRLSRLQRRILAGLLAGLTLVLCWHILYGQPPELSPQQAVQALEQTFAAPSYSFTTKATVLLEGQHRLFCDLSGQKSGENRHLWGELLGTPLNIYLVEGEMYQQNALDKSWRRVAETSLNEAARLLGEIAPEQNFAYADTGPISYEGLEEQEGQELHKLTLKPLMQDVWLQQYFTDISATLWLDSKGEYMVQAQTRATSAENPGVELIINNSFSDFGAEINIAAPL